MCKDMDIRLADRLSSVGEYYFSKKLRRIAELREGGRDIISLGIGSPDMAPHMSVTDALAAEAGRPDAHGYRPYAGIADLREAFAEWYGTRYGVSLTQAEVLPLIGSKEGLMHIAMTYIDPGDRVLIPNPGYPAYRSAFTLAGAECVEYRLRGDNGWQPDIAGIEAEGVDGVKIMVVNYPNMPTGAMPRPGLFDELVAFAGRHNILLVSDNPYSFIRTDRPVSIMQSAGAMEVALELNSLSKSHNMAGWRIGALIGDSRRLSEVMRFKSNMDSGMFGAMQVAAAVALRLGDEWYSALNEAYAERERLGYRIMEQLGCRADKGQAGLFVWGRIPDDESDCYSFIDSILDCYDVFVTPGGIFGSEGERYVRISLCADVATLGRVSDRISDRVR